MARFVTVNVQCDWTGCDTTAPEGDGVVISKELSIDGKQGREFLLCKQHIDAFELIVLPLMAAGVKVAEAPKRTTRSSASIPPADAGIHTIVNSVPCLHEGCTRDDIKNRAGLAQHVTRSHGYESLAEYERIHHVHID